MDEIEIILAQTELGLWVPGTNAISWARNARNGPQETKPYTYVWLSKWQGLTAAQLLYYSPTLG